jgi:hypothetical protein
LDAAPPLLHGGTRRFAPPDPPDLVAEIRVVDGPDGELVARQQARVLWEITEWLAQNRSEPGQARAA